LPVASQGRESLLDQIQGSSRGERQDDLMTLLADDFQAVNQVEIGKLALSLTQADLQQLSVIETAEIIIGNCLAYCAKASQQCAAVVPRVRWSLWAETALPMPISYWGLFF
jgi:hypothetical protein